MNRFLTGLQDNELQSQCSALEIEEMQTMWLVAGACSGWGRQARMTSPSQPWHASPALGLIFMADNLLINWCSYQLCTNQTACAFCQLWSCSQAAPNTRLRGLIHIPMGQLKRKHQEWWLLRPRLASPHFIVDVATEMMFCFTLNIYSSMICGSWYSRPAVPTSEGLQLQHVGGHLLPSKEWLERNVLSPSSSFELCSWILFPTVSG